jgi:hypothetical protein
MFLSFQSIFLSPGAIPVTDRRVIACRWTFFFSLLLCCDSVASSMFELQGTIGFTFGPLPEVLAMLWISCAAPAL